MPTDNPLLLRNPLPRFGEIRAAHVLPAITGLLDARRAQLDALLAAPVVTFRSLVEPLEDSQHELAAVWSQVSHLNAVLNSPDLREAYNACLPLLSAWQTDLAQNEALCRACQRIADERPEPRCDAAAGARAPPARVPPGRRRAGPGTQGALQGADAAAHAAHREVRRERSGCDQCLVASR